MNVTLNYAWPERNMQNRSLAGFIGALSFSMARQPTAKMAPAEADVPLFIGSNWATVLTLGR